MKRSLLIVVFLALTITLIRSQDITVRAWLDTNKALIGDQLKLHIAIDKPADGWQVQFPALKDTLANRIEIISTSENDTIPAGNDRMTLKKDVLFAVFDTGLFEIPALAFAVKNNDYSDTVSSLPVRFEIMPVKADSTIHDIKSIYKNPITFRETIPYIAGIIVLVLLAWLLIYYVNHRKHSLAGHAAAGVKRIVPSEPADVIALRELEQLKQEKPWMNNKIKYFHIRISEVLRLYIERRFNTPALEQTTDEILFSLKSQPIPATEFSNLSSVLHLSDWVKFARVIPDASENAMQIDMAIEFVKNTPMVVENETPENNNSKVKTDS